MTRIAVLGSTGHTGRMVVDALRARGADVLACGRHPRTLAAMPGETRVVDVRSRDDVHDALHGVDAVANLAGPFLDTGHVPIEEAITHGVPYADTTGEQPFMVAARERHHERARIAGVAVVNALAFEYAFSDLTVRAHLPQGGDALHVLYRARSAHASAGTKKSILRVMASPARGHEDGQLVPTTPGAHTHRFATMSGARDGISFPGGEILTVPSHTAFRTVRTYMPGPASRARATRLLAPLARATLRGPVLAAAEALVDARHKAPENERARGEIYLDARIAEGDTRRLLIETPDPYLATAELMAEGILRLARRSGDGGVLAPAEALDARATLAALRERMPNLGVRAVKVLPAGVIELVSDDDKPL